MGIYDVESFFWALEQLHGSFSDIGAHQDFRKSKFFMPELLLIELWKKLTRISCGTKKKIMTAN